MMKTNEKMSPGDLEALLPWYAAGTLGSRETDQVEQALAQDSELARRYDLVRDELAETILLNESIGAPSARVMDSLFKAIDKEPRTASAAAAPRGVGAWVADLLMPRALAWSAAAAAVIILLQGGVITWMVLEEPAPFKTASFPEETRGLDSYALVRFAPRASIADISRFLDSRKAVIVDGPKPGGPGGMYRVRIAQTVLSRDELDRVIKEMQAATDVVSFVSPTE